QSARRPAERTGHTRSARKVKGTRRTDASRDSPCALGPSLTDHRPTRAAPVAGDGAARRRSDSVSLGVAAAMSIPALRTLQYEQVRNFGRFGDAIDVPPLTDVQTRSYERFLQLDVPPEKRTPTGLEGVLREIFPIESYDKKLSLEYVKYELGKPRYDPTECRQLRLTYGRPFRVWLRLRKDQPV